MPRPPLICPECAATGLKSRVFSDDSGWRTLMAGQQRYWDEDGVYHDHDPNDPDTYRFRCSNKHSFTMPALKECGCRIPL